MDDADETDGRVLSTLTPECRSVLVLPAVSVTVSWNSYVPSG